MKVSTGRIELVELAVLEDKDVGAVSLQVDTVLGMLVADKWRMGADFGVKRERSRDRHATGIVAWVLNLATALFCQDVRDPTAKLPPYCAPRGPASGVMSGVARPKFIDKRLVVEHVGKDVSGFGVM